MVKSFIMEQKDVTQFLAVIRVVKSLAKQLEISNNQLHGQTSLRSGSRSIMEYLYKTGPSAVPKISRDLSVSRQYIQLEVNSLLDRGDIQSLRNPGHSRSNLFSLTQRGKKELTALRVREAHALASLNLNLTSDEFKVTQTTLLKIYEKFQAVNWADTRDELI